MADRFILLFSPGTITLAERQPDGTYASVAHFSTAHEDTARLTCTRLNNEALEKEMDI